MSSEAKPTGLPNSQCKYEVLEILGEGAFGQVVKGRNVFTKELVALKAHTLGEYSNFYFHQELRALELIKKLDPDVFNIIRLIEHFDFNGHQCMAFEMLDQTVDRLMKQEIAFSLHEIRPMAQQLLMTLSGLQSIGVVHTDIKPDNIMLVNHMEQPFKVKLIDFGVAESVSQLMTGELIQPDGFRAIEVTLGLPVTEAVDMWSLASCLLLWYLGERNLTSDSDFDNLSMIVDMLGIPPEELLNKGLHTNEFFIQENSKWRLKTLQEYQDSTGEDPEMYERRERATLEELIKEPSQFESSLEARDKEAFYDLIKKMFDMNSKTRITPAEALRHPFITMAHLPRDRSYTELAHQYMCVVGSDFEPLQKVGLSGEHFGQDTQQVTEDRDPELAVLLDAAKEELSIDSSEILEHIETLFQDEDATENQTEQKTSMFKRAQGLFSRAFNRLKLSPKKPFFRKPKWVTRIFSRK